MPLQEYKLYTTMPGLVLGEQSSHVSQTSSPASKLVLLNAKTETVIEIIP
jgi:hypothetical protein